MSNEHVPGDGAAASAQPYPRPILRQIPTGLSSKLAERMAKRVIAPYITLERKGEKVVLRREANAYSFYLTKKSSVLMKNLSAFISNSYDLPGLLHETADVLKDLTESIGGRLYFVDHATGQLHLYQNHVTYPRCRVNYNIQPGGSVASYVAYTKEYVCVEDVTVDTRFPDGVSYKDTVKPVLAVPIITEDRCYAVMEFYRDMYQPPYSKGDLKTVVLVCGWIGLAIQQNQDGVILHMKQEVNDDVLQLVLAYFGKLVTFENFISDILVNFANTFYTKRRLSAEYGTVYVITTDNDEMYADVYEDGIISEADALIKKRSRVKIGREQTVASTVARTGELMNVKDLHNDPRFVYQNLRLNDSIFIHRSELCAPVKNRDQLLGLISVTNNKNGLYFNPEDESLIKIVATYACMAFHHALSLRDNEISKLQLQEALTLLDYHVRPCEHSLQEINEECEIPKNITEFSWYIVPADLRLIPQLYMHLLLEICGSEFVDLDSLKHFVLTVQRSYRDNYYHNFEHAFNVSHCMYAILLRNREAFSQIEIQALLIAALVHDIDHSGVNNNFLMITNHLFSKLYHSSPWENHHTFVAMRILAKYRVFTNLEGDDYTLFLEEVTNNIMATDLVYYFKSRTKLMPLIKTGQLDMEEPQTRCMVKRVMMTMADLSGQTKLYSISKRLTDQLYEEFYAQGDLEKELGYFPLPSLDRECQNIVPDDQAHFITIVVMTCAYLLKEIFPNTEDLYANAENLRDCWKKIIELRGSRIWRQGDSIIQ